MPRDFAKDLLFVRTETGSGTNDLGAEENS